MSHMVIYRGVDGKPGYHQTDDIHDAVNFVETMRNEEGVEHARIFRLEEVVFEYRPYYRVELTNGAAIENGSGTAEIAGGAAQVGAGSKDGADGDGDAETVDEAVDVVEASDGEAAADATDNGDGSDGDVSENGEKAEAGAGKKGLFGR